MTYEYKSPLQERDGDFKVTDGDITGATNDNWDDAYQKRVDQWVHPLQYSNNTASLDKENSGIHHGGLSGLGDDDHGQYWADVSIGQRTEDYTTTGTVTVGTLTDGDVVITGGNITGTDIDIAAGTGDYTSTGTGTFGEIIDNGLTALTGVYTDANKQLVSTPPTTGVLGHWDRTGTVLSPANPGDSVKADALHIDNTTGPDAVITMDGTGGNTGVFAYESDTDLFTFNKDVTVNATMDATAYRNIKISGDTPPEVSLETTGTVLGTDLIGCFDWFGNGSGVNQSVAGIEVKANENWSSTEAGTKMLFYATEKNSLNKSYLMALEQISSTAAGVGFGDFSTKAILSEMHLYLNTTGTLNTGIKLEQDGTGDAKLAFILTGSQEYDFGIDNSDGDRLKLSRGTRVSTDTMMQWDTSGNANILGNVRIGDTTAPTYALEVAGVTKTESGRIVKTTRLTADGTTLSTAHHEVFCDTDGGAFTVTLPATPVGQTYRITNSGSNNLTLGRNGNTIKGSATDATVPSGDTLILTWEPTEGWW